MPVINEYRQQTQASGPGVNPSARAPDIGDAVAGIGQAVSRAAMTAADVYVRHQDEDARLYAQENLPKAQVALTEQYQALKGQAGPGAPEFTKRWAEEYQKFEEQALASAPNERTRKYMAEGLKRYGQSLTMDSLSFEQSAREAKKAEAFTSSLDSRKKLAFANPDYAMTAAAELKAELEADPDFDPIETGKAVVAGVQDIYFASESSRAQKNPAKFLQDAKAREGRGTWNGLTHENQQRLLQAAEADVKRLQAEARERIELDIQDHQAMALAGVKPPREYSRGEIIGAYGAERGQRVWERYNATMRAGDSIRAFQTMPQDDILAELAKSKPTVADADGFDAKNDAWKIKSQAAQQVLQLRNSDPAAYVAQQTPVIKQALDRFMAAPDDPAARDDYITKAMAEQKRLGIQNPQVLPQAVADQYVARFRSSNPEQQAQLMTALSGAYGRNWPKVFGQMAKDLPPGALIIGTVAPKAQTHAARAMSVPKDELFKAVPSGDKSDMQAALGTAMADLRMSLSASVGGEQTFATVYDSAERMAALYMQQGMAPAAAAQKAAAHLTSEIYSFNSRDGNVYRVPAQYDADAVDEGTGNALDSLDGYDIRPPAGLDKKSYISVLKDAGYWVTNDDESGVYLYDSTGSVVRLSDGRPLMFNFDELARVGAD